MTQTHCQNHSYPSIKIQIDNYRPHLPFRLHIYREFWQFLITGVKKTYNTYKIIS